MDWMIEAAEHSVSGTRATTTQARTDASAMGCILCNEVGSCFLLLILSEWKHGPRVASNSCSLPMCLVAPEPNAFAENCHRDVSKFRELCREAVWLQRSVQAVLCCSRKVAETRCSDPLSNQVSCDTHQSHTLRFACQTYDSLRRPNQARDCTAFCPLAHDNRGMRPHVHKSHCPTP